MNQSDLTPAMVRILQTFLEDPDRTFYATELMKAARVGSGSLYPALTRMQNAEWLVEEPEDIDPRKEGRPARRNFTITPKGALEAHHALVELSAAVRPPASSPGWLVPKPLAEYAWAAVERLGSRLGWTHIQPKGL
ncbi:PadR family transcriptional regulator (plasmid) [Streptomyces europaeiscabiei]|uniref:PadR family transcriptional regulator n=1 Tax=Streptomyces europaeiscabiei TaxID=146819 RepID=UPI002E811D40|nr:PadR family transcriptional regulator [Streptomyces europaeiscabiei]WUD38855.1 PadR family transcriptional regulator [Streptomyces europaeiscabiei]